MSGGPGEGSRDLEQAKAAPEGGQLRSGGAGEETGGHGCRAGQIYIIANMPCTCDIWNDN